jgi:hypothetical protein
MSETMTEAQEPETWGESLDGESEPAGESLESEAYPAEAGWAESSGDARRRRQRQIMLARRQAQLSRPPAQPPAPAPPRPVTAGPSASQAARAASQAVRAVRDDVLALDLDTKAALRSLRHELKKAKQHGNEAAYAATGAIILNQGLDTFGTKLIPHPFVRALMRAAPLGLLYSYGPERGAARFFGNPIFVGVAGTAAILISEKLATGSWESPPAEKASDQVPDLAGVSLAGPSAISKAAGPTQLKATAVDQQGNKVANSNYVWRTDNPVVASVDPDGNVTGHAKGRAWITATSDGVTGRLRVKISK